MDAVAEVDEVRMVDDPEKWTPAETITHKATIQTLKGTAEIKITALSGEQHNKVIKTLVRPEAPLKQIGRGAPVSDFEDKAYVLAQAEIEFKRMVMSVDMCALEIPGETLDLKSQWASENLWHRDELKQIYDQIIKASGFGTGYQRQSESVPVIITSAKEWSEMSRQTSEYVFDRSSEKIGFVLKPISRMISSQIEMACPDPEVPTVPSPRHLPGTKPTFVKNEKDPRYLDAVDAVASKRMILVLEASLPWKLPGDTMEQKLEWLRKRPAGEVSTLYNHVFSAVNKFRSRSDFI